ncbi:phytoene dehydrogenase [Actinorhabdospora filicis]|uniref:Phytoene dehydrogenase n=1 Tax=Actinorhabdospora filicis TaxID=1785913 RepID=A0A9W6SQ55_9ACTN|nr:phytoene dehydrogenase [Actinorhabdospora filicis]
MVVGAGLAGLACALHLRGAGAEVTVLERAAAPGGVAAESRVGGHRFDLGPTVLTAPDLLDRAFAAVGERASDRLDLVRLDPAYRGLFADGSTLDVLAEPEAMAAYLERECGRADAEGYLRYAAHVGELYRIQIRDFIDRSLDTPRDLLTLNLLRLAAKGGFGRLGPLVERHFRDERLRRLFSFQALYAGLAPSRALALYAVISYLDAIAGVWYPRGGMHQVPLAMAAAAAAAGVEFHYGAEATGVETRAGRAIAVHAGQRYPADAVVLAVDRSVAARLLDRAPRRGRSSPSCVVVHLAAAAGARPGLAHHNLVFGAAWDETFRDIIDRGRVMRDPSLLVTNPGDGGLYVLAPAPNLAVGGIDWDERGPSYAAELLDGLARRGIDLPREPALITTPADWARAGHTDGTPFALAHTFAQTGPFRPRIGVPGLANVAMAGAATQPGVGVPMVLVSGRLAARKVLGAQGVRGQREI